jgi:adenosylmethionine-8-amino-7-oxononanoate aminotransferase
MSPDGLDHVFLADSGSVAVEVSVKMCLQYWRSLGRPAKSRLLTWRGGYHGDTWQPMSVCDPDGGMHDLWTGVLPRQVFVDAPPAEYDEAYADQLRTQQSRSLRNVLLQRLRKFREPVAPVVVALSRDTRGLACLGDC